MFWSSQSPEYLPNIPKISQVLPSNVFHPSNAHGWIVRRHWFPLWARHGVTSRLANPRKSQDKTKVIHIHPFFLTTVPDSDCVFQIHPKYSKMHFPGLSETAENDAGEVNWATWCAQSCIIMNLYRINTLSLTKPRITTKWGLYKIIGVLHGATLPTFPPQNQGFSASTYILHTPCSNLVHLHKTTFLICKAHIFSTKSFPLLRIWVLKYLDIAEATLKRMLIVYQ